MAFEVRETLLTLEQLIENRSEILPDDRGVVVMDWHAGRFDDTCRGTFNWYMSPSAAEALADELRNAAARGRAKLAAAQALLEQRKVGR